MTPSQFPGGTLQPIPGITGGEGEYSVWQKICQNLYNISLNGGGGGGAGNPGGINGQVQYNNAGVFGGFTGMTITGGALSALSGGVSVNGITLAGTGGSTLNVGAGGTLGTGAFAAAITIPGLATQVLTSNGSGGVTATGVTVDTGNNVTGIANLYLNQGGPSSNYAILLGPNVAGPSTGVIKYSNSTDGLIFDTWASGKEFRMGGSKIVLGVSEGGSVVGRVLVHTTTDDGINALQVAGSSAVTISDSSTNTIVNALTVTHATSATAAAGLGVGALFQLPSNAGMLRSAGQINSVWVGTPTDGAENSELDFFTLNNGSPFLAVSISPNGSITFNGAIVSGVWTASRIGTAYGGVAIDTGWTANASGGSKTVAVQNFSASGFTGTMATALNTVSAGTGTFFAAQAQQVQDLTNKLQALEATLVLSTMPNA